MSILRAVVLWKDWKHVLHLTDCAAAFCNGQNLFTRWRATVNAYRLQLALRFLGALVSRAFTLLLCPVKPVSNPARRSHIALESFHTWRRYP